MQVASSIFKAYDIRGVVPSTVTEQVAEAIGKAFGTVARLEGETSVAVGRDGRLSGPALSTALVRGLVAAGQHVVYQWHSGDRQTQSKGLQRLQDGDAGACHLRRGNPESASDDGG